ncbi:MAG: hypothetical protein ACFFAS_16515 [Promethearchaeota archaeon]
MDLFKNILEKGFKGWGKIFTVSDLIQELNIALIDKGFHKTNSRLVFSVCSDDCNRLAERETVEKALTKIFNREFHLGGIAGYPIGGVSGIIAASHHPPDVLSLEGLKERNGNLIFFASPHIGVIKRETITYGSFVRPGQQKPTASCDAMMGFLNALKMAQSSNGLSGESNDLDIDPSKTIIYEQLIDNYSERLDALLELNDINQQVIELFKINHDLVETALLRMIDEFKKREHFSGKIVLISGITINISDKDYFVLKQIKHSN